MKYMRSGFYVLLVAGVFIFVYRIYFSKAHNAPKPNQTTESERPVTTGDLIKVDSEILKDTEIKSIQVKPVKFTSALTLTGEVAINPDKTAKISARLPGVVTNVSFKEGDRIRKGDVLATIDSPEAARINTKYLSSLSKCSATRRNAQRVRELVELRLAGEQEALNAESDLKIQEAELRSDRTNLRLYNLPLPDLSNIENTSLGKLEIRSTVSGIAISRDILQGTNVDANTPVGTVADLSELWFLAKIFETDLDAIRPDEKAVVRLNPYPSELFQGRITYIGNQIDPVSRTVLARIIIRNRKNLVRVGLFGTAEVTTVDPEIIAIRPETISSIDGKDFVFIEEKPGEYRLREVKTGRKNNALVEIKSGLEEEEYLVESGIFLLKSKLLKKTFGGE